jgi:hypothetical protein
MMVANTIEKRRLTRRMVNTNGRFEVFTAVNMKNAAF